jgi:hypothetical protein
VELNAQPISDLTKMKKQEKKNQKLNKNNSITNKFIILMFSVISLFAESILIIISLFKKGIFKKEILSEKTDLGFDLIIKRK